MEVFEIIIRHLEESHGQPLPRELRKYLWIKYSVEPFPYEYTEQDLHENIRRDIRDYLGGTLDITEKNPLTSCNERIKSLQDMFIGMLYDKCQLELYVAELEHTLSEHGLESTKMAQRRLAFQTESPF